MTSENVSERFGSFLATSEPHAYPMRTPRAAGVGAMNNVSCPSLYLHDGTLLACALNQHPHGDAYHSNEDSLIVWSANEAVPVPWPPDQEPSAGIDLLADIGVPTDSKKLRRYLHRVGRNAWQWHDTTTPPTRYKTGQLWPAATAVGSVIGDLIVVRP